MTTAEEGLFEWSEPDYDSEDDAWYVVGTRALGPSHILFHSVNLSPLRTARERLNTGDLDPTLQHIVELLLKSEGIE